MRYKTLGLRPRVFISHNMSLYLMGVYIVRIRTMIWNRHNLAKNSWKKKIPPPLPHINPYFLTKSCYQRSNNKDFVVREGDLGVLLQFLLSQNCWDILSRVRIWVFWMKIHVFGQFFLPTNVKEGFPRRSMDFGGYRPFLNKNMADNRRARYISYWSLLFPVEYKFEYNLFCFKNARTFVEYFQSRSKYFE